MLVEYYAWIVSRVVTYGLGMMEEHASAASILLAAGSITRVSSGPLFGEQVSLRGAASTSLRFV